MFTCFAMLLTVSWWFSRQFDKLLQCFLLFWLLLAILISLHQWHFLFPKKNVSPTCKLLFSSKRYPCKLALTSTNNKKFNVRSLHWFKLRHSRSGTPKHADNNRCHSERDCHRSITTQLWNTNMSASSNHTNAFVQCCHGKHTVASSRTLLSVHVFLYRIALCWKYYSHRWKIVTYTNTENITSGLGRNTCSCSLYC